MNIITSEILFYILIGLTSFSLILLVWNIRLELKVRRLMRGKSGRSLEDSFVAMNKDIDDYKKFKNELEQYLKHVERRVVNSIQGVESINFNAFTGAESGGKSFAVAFVNEKGDGVLISSLHARDRLSIFTKKIRGGKAELDLSEEESDALTKALKSCSV